MQTHAPYTVITGASKGLGKALAVACAKRKRNVILVSLPGEAIQDLADSLALTYQIQTASFEADLTDSEELQALCDWIKSNFEIDLLINNAGVGGSAQFDKIPKSKIDQMMLLNVRALVMLTHELLPLLKDQKEGYILNIASMASFSPIPFKTVYPATKAFVYSFSRGLSAELSDGNITVSVAHPGPMPTNPEVSRRIAKHNRLVKKMTLTAEETAEICLHRLFKRNKMIIPGLMNQISLFILKLFPVGWKLVFLRKTIAKEIATDKQQVKWVPQVQSI